MTSFSSERVALLAAAAFAVVSLLVLHAAAAAMEPKRAGPGEKCSTSDINLSQGPGGSPLTFTVDITNVCATGCDISGIHVSCSGFSSGSFINPKVFKPLGGNDCLVNDGKPLLNGQAITFQYSNTVQIPPIVSSVVCC